MSDTDEEHNYWRHYSMSLSLTFLVLIIIEILRLLIIKEIIIFLLFLFSLFSLITLTLTYLLHKDIKQTEKITQKNLWSASWVRNNYYSYKGLKTIIKEQHRKPQK